MCSENTQKTGSVYMHWPLLLLAGGGGRKWGGKRRMSAGHELTLASFIIFILFFSCCPFSSLFFILFVYHHMHLPFCCCWILFLVIFYWESQVIGTFCAQCLMLGGLSWIRRTGEFCPSSFFLLLSLNEREALWIGNECFKRRRRTRKEENKNVCPISNT
jgi:hypothetical protein